MTDGHSMRGLSHWATHRIPGIPTHAEHPAGHQARARHDPPNRRWNHSPARQPRVLVAWQRRIAGFFGQEPR
jgi:hypothetical protein